MRALAPVHLAALLSAATSAFALATAGCRQAPAAAPPQGEIQFAAVRDGRIAVLAVRPDGAGGPRVVAAAPDRDLFPAPGPRALAIAVAGDEESHEEQLVLVEGGAARALGFASARVRNPSWAPDGSWVAFESDRDGFREIYRLDVATGAVRRLTENREGNFEPSVSPDGRRIAFVSSRDGDPELYVMDADGDGGRATRLTFFHREDTEPAWSPDGAWIAFVSDREGVERIFLVRPDGTGARRLNDAALPGPETSPVWSPDGRRVAYLVREPQGAGTAVYVTDLATGVARRLSPAGAHDHEPSWSSDGRWLVVSSGKAGTQATLHLVRADGTSRRQLTDSGFLPRWRPGTVLGNQDSPSTRRGRRPATCRPSRRHTPCPR